MAYRKQLLKAVKVDPESTIEQLDSSSYFKMKKNMRENQISEKRMIRLNARKLLQSGFGFLQADHKWIQNRTMDAMNNGLAVILIITREDIYSSILLDFKAVNSTAEEPTLAAFNEILSEYGLLNQWKTKTVALVGDAKFDHMRRQSMFINICFAHTLTRVVRAMSDQAFIFGINERNFKDVDTFISEIARSRKPTHEPVEEYPRTVNEYLKKTPVTDADAIKIATKRSKSQNIVPVEEARKLVKRYKKFRVRLKINSVLIIF